MSFITTSSLLPNKHLSHFKILIAMRIIFERSWTLILLLAITVSAHAQKDLKKYKEEADVMRKEVWGWKKPEFNVRDIPAEYANASRVVIARHMEINADSKKKAAFTGFGFGAYRQLYLTEIAREAIKINDKAAVSDYSEIAFTQIARSSGFFLNNTTNVYIGVRVIKPDGTVKEVSADDIVLTRNDASRKEAKLAIPDLQPGDIIDYFLAKQQSMEQSTLGDISNYSFTLFDDAPVMYYSIHIEMGKKYAVEYRCYNGAPDFKRSTTEDDDNVFDMVVKNIPAYAESGLWISPFRQLPMIRMNIKVGYRGMYAGRFNAREPGKVYANPPADEFIEDEKITISDIKTYEMRMGTGGSMGIAQSLSGNTSKYYFQVLKNKDKLPFDSVAAELYYLYRYATFLNVAPYTDINSVIGTPQRAINPNSRLYDFGSLLRGKDIDCDMVFVTSRSGPYLKEILSSGDINWMLLARGDKDKLFGMSDIFSPAFHIPSEYENTKQAMTMRVVGRKKNFDEGSVNIPGSSPSENTRIETINIIPAANGTDLQVNRKTILKGYYKSDVQKNLVLLEDFCNSERKLFGEDKTMIEELEAMKSRKSYAPELKAAFDNARVKQKDEFVNEAKEWFDQPVTDLTDYKVDNLGVRHNNPDFVYSSKFNIGGLIKKAGNNMIIDIGKLQGSPLKISPAQRKRKLDIYMPFARSIQAQITLQIPDGYTAEGINELNKKVENETGYFMAEATTDGKTVTIKVRKSYNHAFEPVGNWEKMLAFIDAANEWGNAKILLKKK
jgi:hypothetical protein